MNSQDPAPRTSLLLLSCSVFFTSLALILYELLLTRLFAVVLFAQFAHLALALALLGVSVGAVAQHLWPSLIPRQGYERKVGFIVLFMAIAAVIAVLAVLNFPVIKTADSLVRDYQDRSGMKDQLLNKGWFFALLPVLSLPFAFGGLAFSGIFQRLKDHISRVYAADLVGGALGAILFVPVLQSLAGPDAIFVVTAMAGLGAFLAFMAGRWRPGQGLGVALILLSLGAITTSRVGGEILKIRQAAGYDEARISHVRWTALTRLCLYELHGKVKLLLDNASASEVVRTEKDLPNLVACEARSLVYRIHDQPARIAILGASAGPEVAIAQSLGFSDIYAVDIASEGFDLVAETFPDAPLNPYLQPGIHKVHADGRAAILQSAEPFDIIQMVHANLWSSAGLLSNAWSPSLIETREAFSTYLDRLSPDGTISFGRGSMTIHEVRSATAALQARGVKDPWTHIAWVKGTCETMLVKGRPWTQEERLRLTRAFTSYKDTSFLLDPTTPDRNLAKRVRKLTLMTDDRPYLDSPVLLWNAFAGFFSEPGPDGDGPMETLYGALVVQILFVLASGLLFILAPWLWRGRSEMAGLRGSPGVLAYVAGLGFGYLSIETVLIHQIVLFVGHPTYAVTVVVLAMLLGSGLGSAYTHRIGQQNMSRTLRIILGLVLVLGLIQAFVFPPLLHAFALGFPLTIRLSLTFVLLLPLGFIMGMPFPLGLRLLPGRTEGIVPWAWAINGWMSVAASLITILVSRLYGYSWALVIALLAYLACLFLVGTLPRLKAPEAP